MFVDEIISEGIRHKNHTRLQSQTIACHRAENEEEEWEKEKGKIVCCRVNHCLRQHILHLEMEKRWNFRDLDTFAFNAIIPLMKLKANRWLKHGGDLKLFV